MHLQDISTWLAFNSKGLGDTTEEMKVCGKGDQDLSTLSEREWGKKAGLHKGDLKRASSYRGIKPRMRFGR